MEQRMSDHGELLGAHGGLHQKWYCAYEEVVYVPFIVHNPVLFNKHSKVNMLLIRSFGAIPQRKRSLSRTNSKCIILRITRLKPRTLFIPNSRHLIDHLGIARQLYKMLNAQCSQND
jgi:hypothetical protein